MIYPGETYNDINSINQNEKSLEIISNELSVSVTEISNSSHTKNMDLVSKIKFYTHEHNFNKALELCNSEEGRKRIIVQSRKVNLLLKMFRESNDIYFLDEALKTCEMYVGNEIFDSHRNKIYNILTRVYINRDDFNQLELNSLIRKLVDNRKLSLALGFCDLLDNFNDENIDLLRVEILMLKFKDNNSNKILEKANNICIKHSENEKFDVFKKQIDLYLSEPSLLTELLAKVYHGIIDVKEIEDSNVVIWKKQLLMISYYEKNDKKKGFSYIKGLKNDCKEDFNKLKILNLLSERIASKKIKIFDVGLYAAYLNCKIDFDVFDSVLKSYKESLVEEDITVKVVEPVEQQTILNKKKKSSKENKKIISCSGVSINRYSQHSTVDNNASISSQPIIQNNQVLIKEVFSEEILEICLYLYVKMNELDNKKAIKAWDNFENLIYKPISDKGALTRMNSILKKMAEVGILTSKLNDEKIKKYLMK